MIGSSCARHQEGDAFRKLRTLHLSDVDISKISFPSDIIVRDAKLERVRGDNVSFPKILTRDTLVINETKMPHAPMRILVGPDTAIINALDSDFSQFTLDLVDPQKLEVVYLLNSNIKKMDIENKQNSSKLSPTFAMFVKTKKFAMNLRKQIGRSSVFFSDW